MSVVPTSSAFCACSWQQQMTRLGLINQYNLALPHFGLGVSTSSGLVRLLTSDRLRCAADLALSEQ